MQEEHTYIAIDLKSFYASAECVDRGLDPLTTNLVVADVSRTEKTICLAVSPSLKQYGIPGRPRLFEAKQAIRRYERKHRTKICYETAVPRMAEYERVSAKIYSVYLKYIAPEDVHVYSIDEVFIDCTPYLHFYAAQAEKKSKYRWASMGGSVISTGWTPFSRRRATVSASTWENRARDVRGRCWAAGSAAMAGQA